jgi:nicotinic acid phosphoribosyltransferase
LRQDSGDPFSFAPQAKEAYERLCINYREKTIIYSDSLDVDKAIALKKQCEEIGFIRLFSLSSVMSSTLIRRVCVANFGMGTFFTNNFRSSSSNGQEESRALNIVIKLASINSFPCIKISDDLMKVPLTPCIITQASIIKPYVEYRGSGHLVESQGHLWSPQLGYNVIHSRSSVAITSLTEVFLCSNASTMHGAHCL